MALEIERRFLVRGDGWRDHVAWQAELQQGYLVCGEDGLTTRVRLQRSDNGKESAWLTIKAKAAATAPSHARLEFEYAIPTEDALALLELAPWRVSKTRHGLLLPCGDWVLDVFSGANAPLVLAEVEIEQAEDNPPIPSWCGREVTGLHPLSNAALARHPWQDWTTDDRNALEPGLTEGGRGTGDIQQAGG